jgi:hypothetical protein
LGGAKFMLIVHTICQNEAENIRINCQSPSTHVEQCNEVYVLEVKGVLVRGWG